MFKPLFLTLGLLTTAALHAETVPALAIGEAQPVALKDIVSIKFTTDQLTLLQTDGTQLHQDLQPLRFTTIEEESALPGLQQPTDAPVAIYTLSGKLVQQTGSQQLQSALSSLPAAPYILRQGNSNRVIYNTTRLQSTAATTLTGTGTITLTGTGSATTLTDTTSPVLGGLAASNIPAADVATVTALQIQGQGIDPQLALSRVDSLAFSDDQRYLYLYYNGQGSAFAVQTLTGINFPALQEYVSINYAGDQVDGINPYIFDGVFIFNDGAGVSVTNFAVMQEVEYQLTGSSDNGYFHINSEYKWKATLVGLNLTNPNGSVILSHTGKKGTIKSQNGYTNNLCDGAQYTELPDIAQKAAIFGEGQLVFSGKGTLNVTSLAKHGIASDDYVSFENGQVNVLSAIGDAVHANDSVLVQSGTVTLASLSDGIDCEGPVTIRRGEKGAPTLTITTTADGAKGIKTGHNFLMTDGNVTINQTGGPDTSGDDKSNVISIKAERNITIQGGKLVINNTAKGGKAFSAGGTLTISDNAEVIQ